ncbi:MAG: bifunctional chorismate mutase/prephenate dehydrogenase [Desulfobacterales bacterium]
MKTTEKEKDIDGTLVHLREDIEEIDRQMVSLLVKRQKVVDKIVDLKKVQNLPVYHPAREEYLISNRRSQSRETGLNPDFVEEIFRAVIRQSRIKQTRDFSRKGIRPGAVILIVGGHGEMGRYFCRYFGDSGYEVRIMGRNDWEKAEQLCEGLDLAILSVPIDQTPSAAMKLGTYLPEDCILTDLTSIKLKPLKAMLKAHSGPVVGLHPLFGPTPSSMDKQIVVMTPGRNEPACQWLVDQFAAWGAVIVKATAEEHDDIMGIVQTLRHFATFAFGQFLARRRIDICRTLEFSSPIYRLELGMVGRLFAQDESLYSEIIFASPERRELLKDYLKSLNSNLEMIETGNKALFEKEFKKIAQWFGPFSEQAMRESSFMIEKLIERF